MNKSEHNQLRTGGLWAPRILFTERSPWLASLSLLALLLVMFVGGTAQAQDAALDTPASVNINMADVETLAKVLVGVGDSRAEDIVRYRETYGPFATVEELAEVKGVGAATVENNRAVITLE